MGYRSLRECVADLERHGRLVRVAVEIDADLEMAEIQRRVYASGGPALLFENVRDCRFPMVSNLFGTIERARFMFRDTIDGVRRLIELKTDPNNFWKRPTRYWKAPWMALGMLPRSVGRGAVDQNETRISDLPALRSWPDDGGPFITLPQVYSENVESPGLLKSNLGMYRVQLSGNRDEPDREIGLHYQIHRGIGVHHQAAVRQQKPFPVNVFVGGNPAMTLAAVMPLPEGMSELTFAGALAGHRIRMVKRGPLSYYADADFCIRGTVPPGRLPEGPFGDHLGYYSLQHEFPVLEVEAVHHRDDAIWPFTVVGRPPQEDTVFGELIHELTGPVIPTVIPGVRAVNAVDAAGVHPLMLAIGSERYTPYARVGRPQELLTQANAILGQGQMSLAKYLLIINGDDAPDLSIQDERAFFTHLLERVDWRRDLHFQTRTTIDTLDYSGHGMNQGSKVVIAANGDPIRTLPKELPGDFDLPDGLRNPHIAFPGCLVLTADGYVNDEAWIARICRQFPATLHDFPLVILADDSQFAAASMLNFLWVVFTRSNPAVDIHGVGASLAQKHWGCTGPLMIDARIKPHHAPPLIEDPAVLRKIDALASRGGDLATYL